MNLQELGLGCGIAVAFAILLVVVVAAFAGGVYLVARRATLRRRAVWTETAAATGLRIEDDPVRPRMVGTVHGVEVTVDMPAQPHLHVRPERFYRSWMAWTRVLAPLTRRAHVQVRPRGRTFGQKPLFRATAFEDEELDRRYEVFADSRSALDEALRPEVRNALRRAEPAVHLHPDRVVWAEPWIARDAHRLTGAVRSCAAVAAALVRETVEP
ncbi:MAG: hypothetical protein PVG07_03540 [Acidobacteriota bacterium]|jgi:hypothetical protein